MYICVCNAVTERQIREHLAGATDARMRDLHRELGIATCCRHCCRPARELIREHAQAVRDAAGRGESVTKFGGGAA